MIFVFDLDDTLYDEITYVQSGFRAVADYLYQTCQIPFKDCYQTMIATLEEQGRGKVFDVVLSKYGICTQKSIRLCLTIYRMHKPNISLWENAEICLQKLQQQNYPIYIVTDGNKMVQHNKVCALGLYERVKKVFITHRYGIKNAKPSPYCFQLIAKQEKVPTNKIVYIADNPHKDFVGIKPLGFQTIRVLTGHYKDITAAPQYTADYVISNILEMLSIKNLFLQ